MRPPLFVFDADGALSKLQPSAPATEDTLQALVAKHPQLIEDSDGPLLLVQREQPIGDSEFGGGRWAVDHLFVTRSAVPVLVEVKRAADTRLRREVVGQLLDYAANAVAYWPMGTVAGVFAETCSRNSLDPDLILGEFLPQGTDVEEFWRQVDSNFKAGRVKLIFVADIVPRELARIVEFLNEQMAADVRAVELNYYEGGAGLKTLSPRVIGETERARSQKSSSTSPRDRLSVDDWLDARIRPLGEETMEGFRIALGILDSLGAELGVAHTGGSIYVKVFNKDGKAAYPMHLWEAGTISLTFYWVWKRPEAPEEVRRDFYDRLAAVVGKLSTQNLRGFPAFPAKKLVDPEVAKGFEEIAAAWLARFST